MIEKLREVHELQGTDGNWDASSYMLGMFNGLELALSILEDRTPQFRKLDRVPKTVVLEVKFQSVEIDLESLEDLASKLATNPPQPTFRVEE
jgi:hypothetical protein